MAEDSAITEGEDEMPAPKGNKFWLARTKHGRDKIFSDPETLRAACYEYFEWCEENPLWEEKVFSATEGIRRTRIAKMRATTQVGMCLFIGMTQETWGEYRKKEGFSSVCKEIDHIIYQQKFAGAAADLLNPAIIARDLGLAEKTENKSTVSVVSISDEEKGL